MAVPRGTAKTDDRGGTAMIGLVLAAMVGQLVAMDPLDWKPGDRAWVVPAIRNGGVIGVPASGDPVSYSLWGQLVEAEDRAGLDDLEKSGAVFWIGRSIELVVVSAHPTYVPPALECRAKDGRKIWMAEAFAGRGPNRR